MTLHEILLDLEAVTPRGTVLTYSRTWQDLPVWDSAPLTVLSRKGAGLEVLRDVPPIEKPFVQTSYPLEAMTEIARRALQREGWRDLELIEETKGWLPQTRGSATQLRLAGRDAEGFPGDWLILMDDRNGRIVRQFNLIMTFAEGSGRVHRHNPIAATTPAGESTLVWVPLRGLDGSGYLRGDYVDTTRGFAKSERIDPMISPYTPGQQLVPTTCNTEGPRKGRRARE